MAKILKEIKDWGYIPIAQMLLFIAVLLIAWFVHNNAPNDITTLNNSAIAISTLLFGFLTLSLTMHLEELRRQKNAVSDLAAELIMTLNKVRENPSLRRRQVHFNPKYRHFGIEGYGASGKAEDVIGEAYDYLLKNMRDVVHLGRVLIFIWPFPLLSYCFPR